MNDRLKGDAVAAHQGRQAAPNSPEWMSAREAAVAVGVSERTIRRAIARGELTARKMGSSFQIAAVDLEWFVADNRQRAGSPQPDLGPESTSAAPRLVALPTSGPQPTTLPQPLSSFVGRRDEVAAISTLLSEPEVRLLTLIGTAGIGKTRLSIEAAGAARAAFPDGVVFVPLAPVTRPELVTATIGQALGLREGQDAGLRERIRGLLRAKRLLLVLDNFEQVLDAAPLVAEILADAHQLTVLVTSRAPLRLSGEREYPVPPLSLMSRPVEATDFATLRAPSEYVGDPLGASASFDSDAVRLFVERVRGNNPSFPHDAHTEAVIAEICARLEGLPLAIELAAARARVLPPPEILTRLRSRLPLLTGGARDALERHRTMRDAIAWSYDLLSPPEQALFRRLAVFAGGFTLEGAEAVGSGGDAGTPDFAGAPSDPAILDGVAWLVEQSLLARTFGPDGEPRFQMLETVREFGLEQLAVLGEEQAAQTAHAHFFVQLARTLQRSTSLVAEQRPLDILDADLANLRAALTWLDQNGPFEEFVGLVTALQGFWFAHSHYQEGRTWLERALIKSDHERVAAADRARVAVALARMAAFQGDQARAEEIFSEAIPRLRDAGDPLDTALGLIWRGSLASHAGDDATAERYLEEALALVAPIDDRDAAAVAASALANLGVAAHGRGDLALATAHHEAALRRFRDHGRDLGVTRSLIDLGDVARDREDHPAAVASYRAGLERIGKQGDMRLVADSLSGIAYAAVAWGQPERAARLFGAAEALRARVGTAILVPSDRAAQDRAVALIQAAFGEAGLAAAWNEGRSLSRARAEIEAALVTAPAPAAPPPPAATPDPGLTPRERDVLRLLAEHRTDREIAEALFLSPRTVGWHVSAILAKLGVASRRQAAALARERGLV